MAGQARVASLDVLASFRASLVVSLSKARPCLEDIEDTVRRTRDWIQGDRLVYWQNEVKRRSRILEQAKQELFSAKFASIRGPATAQQWAVSRAQNALREAEDKLRLVKKWVHEFSNLTDPQLKEIYQARGFISQEMARAVASLTQTLTILESYVRAVPPSSGMSPGPSLKEEESLGENLPDTPREAQPGQDSPVVPIEPGAQPSEPTTESDESQAGCHYPDPGTPPLEPPQGGGL